MENAERWGMLGGLVLMLVSVIGLLFYIPRFIYSVSMWIYYEITDKG